MNDENMQATVSQPNWLQDVQDIKVILQGSMTDAQHMIPFPTREKKSLAHMFKLSLIRETNPSNVGPLLLP